MYFPEFIGYTKNVKTTYNKRRINMTRRNFWSGMGIGIISGAMIGMGVKTQQKQMKRTVNKARRNMEDILQSMK